MGFWIARSDPYYISANLACYTFRCNEQQKTPNLFSSHPSNLSSQIGNERSEGLEIST